MTNKMGLMALGLSMALLSGCGSSGGSDDPTAPVDVATKIVGTWLGDCHQNGVNDYSLEQITFNADGSGMYYGSDYDVAGCDPQNVVESYDTTFDYTIGATVAAADGADAVELNLDAPGTDDWYTMVRFDADNLLLADGENSDNPANRANDFSGVTVFVKQ